MPTIEKLVSRAGYLIDDNMDVDLAIDLFNEAIEEIDTVFGEGKTVTTTLAAGSNTFAFPSDELEIVRILVKGDDGRMYEAKSDGLNDGNNFTGIDHPPDRYTYTRFGYEGRLYPIPQKPTDVTVEYYGGNEKIPSVATDPTLQYVPKFPTRYHRALPLYAAARYFENWEDNPEMRMNYRKQFEKIRDELAYLLERKVRGSRSNFVYVERGWS